MSTAASSRHPQPSPPLNRRTFLTHGLSALSVAAAGASPVSGLGATTSAKPPLDRIEPGYVGPQFFDDRERRALMDVMDTGSPFRYWGPGRPDKVRRFEEAFAGHMGSRFALGVTSGTAALDCAVTGLGIGPGDEVIVPAYTWWSDYTCVVQAGALPVFAEIDATFNLDPEDFRRKITSRTKAVIVVHLLGGPARLAPILKIAEDHGVAVLEDAAQCVGGAYQGRKLGSIGDVGIFSFQINKMITAGEGGALVTDNPLIYERAARFHDMGTLRSLFEERLGAIQAQTFAGENFRMSELTGAVLGAQLPKLDTMIAAMRRHADAVRTGIRDLPGIRMRDRPDPAGDIGYAVYFETANRDARDGCIRELRRRGVPASTLSGSVLLPVEESVIQKRTRHPGWPAFKTPRGKEMRYGPETCPQTIGILDRFVQVRIGPKYTDRIDHHLVESIRGVYREIV